MTIVRVWNENWQVNWELCLETQLPPPQNSVVQCLNHWCHDSSLLYFLSTASEVLIHIMPRLQSTPFDGGSQCLMKPNMAKSSYAILGSPNLRLSTPWNTNKALTLIIQLLHWHPNFLSTSQNTPHRNIVKPPPSPQSTSGFPQVYCKPGGPLGLSIGEYFKMYF